MLNHLELQDCNFSCNFNDNNAVLLSGELLGGIDVSSNPWEPFVLDISFYATINARNASVVGLVASDQENINLLSINLDNNNFDPATQVDSFNVLSMAFDLQSISCQQCNLQLTLEQVLWAVGGAKNGYQANTLQELTLANNFLHGSFPSSSFIWSALSQVNSYSPYSGVPAPAWPQSLELLDISSNANLQGTLPIVGTGYTALRTLRFGGTNISGPVPDSWSKFSSLQEINAHITNQSCPLRQLTNGEVCHEIAIVELAVVLMSQGQCDVLLCMFQLFCLLPSWLEVLPELAQIPVTPTSTELVTGIHCPELGLATAGYFHVVIDPSYYFNTLCKCDAGYWGKERQCVQCPEASVVCDEQQQCIG
jgi:hypothetical protein